MMYVRARGPRRRGARLLLAMTVQPVLSSTRRRVSTLQTNLPFDARFPARTHRYRRFADVLADTHARLAVDRGAATPSLQRTLTSCHLPVSLALSAPKRRWPPTAPAPSPRKEPFDPGVPASSPATWSCQSPALIASAPKYARHPPGRYGCANGVAVESLPDQAPDELTQRHARIDVRQQPLELLQPALALIVDHRLELPPAPAQRPNPIRRHHQLRIHLREHPHHLPRALAGRLIHQRLSRRDVQLRQQLPFRRWHQCRRRWRRAVRPHGRTRSRSRRSKAACNCAAASSVSEPSRSLSRAPSTCAQSFMALIRRHAAASL